MNIQIDKLTPCLEKVSTGKIVNTTFSLATESDLSDLKGWKFKWYDLLPTKFEIYKLTAENDERIQGLVMLENVSTDKAVYVKVAESTPHNMGKQKEYSPCKSLCQNFRSIPHWYTSPISNDYR